MTIVAECRNAVTGVGATIAPGSQKLKGNWADLLNAPTSTRATPICAVVDVGAAARMPCRFVVPAALTRQTNPPSMARPPAPVTSSARCAEARAPASSSSRPMRRNDITDVSSQNTKSVHTSLATTRPNIAAAKRVKYPAKRTTRSEDGSPAKYAHE